MDIMITVLLLKVSHMKEEEKQKDVEDKDKTVEKHLRFLFKDEEILLRIHFFKINTHMTSYSL